MAWLDPWALAAVPLAVVAGVLLYGCNLSNRWKLRHIPGPKPALFLGNLGQAMKAGGTHKYFHECASKYGNVFSFFFGRAASYVVVSEPEMVKEMHTKNFIQYNHRAINDLLNAYKNDPNAELSRLDEEQILVAKPKHWLGLKGACEPMFHSASLKAYAPIINDAADALLQRVEAAGAAPLNVSDLFGAMTLDVIGQAAFGVDFGAQKKGLEEPSELQKGIFIFFQPPNRLISTLVMAVPHLRRFWWCVSAWLKESKLLTYYAGVSYLTGACEALLGTAQAALAPASNGGPHTHSSGKRDGGSSGGKLDVQAKAGTGNGHHGLPAASGARKPDPLGAERAMAQIWESNKARGLADYAGQAPATHSLIHRLAGATHKEEGRPLTQREILAQARFFVLAGYETTASTLAFALHEIAWDPRIQDALHVEIDALNGKIPDYDDLPRFKYTEAVINETLRFYPPVGPIITRRCNALGPAPLGSYTLPQGSQIMLDAYTMQHDPQNFPDPETFKPERFVEGHPDFSRHHPYAYMPFGVGPRKCMGYKLAMEEATLALVRVLQRHSFSVDRARHPTRKLELQSFFTMSAKGGIWLKASPRQ